VAGIKQSGEHFNIKKYSTPSTIVRVKGKGMIETEKECLKKLRLSTVCLTKVKRRLDPFSLFSLVEEIAEFGVGLLKQAGNGLKVDVIG
jgi:hypothetical protein